MKSQKEAPFQVALAEAFWSAGHYVALSDGGTSRWKVRFSSSGKKPDLLVRLWPKSKKMRVVGVEAKTDGPRSISESLDGAQKVIDLSRGEEIYSISVPGHSTLSISSIREHYLATPMSVTEGVLCRWEDIRRKLKWPEVAHQYATLVVQQLLRRYGGGILGKEKCREFGVSVRNDWNRF